jgi:hypothetical protein
LLPAVVEFFRRIKANGEKRHSPDQNVASRRIS